MEQWRTFPGVAGRPKSPQERSENSSRRSHKTPQKHLKNCRPHLPQLRFFLNIPMEEEASNSGLASTHSHFSHGAKGVLPFYYAEVSRLRSEDRHKERKEDAEREKESLSVLRILAMHVLIELQYRKQTPFEVHRE
ncbi:hypothetical protein QTP70_002132 [Hemibagrus guttatus]|uniref:Uncharacterized protein n=1 Tax=Hemibagrus guttatus TaxID=175788 RepID=A0AAE0QZI0_9TELE|nr:hypothetical protein QTP70_002132 [Hemibagrus guttatus]